MNGGIEQALPPALRGLPIARVLRDVGNQPCVEDRFAVAPGIETAIEIDPTSTVRFSNSLKSLGKSEF